MRKAVIPVLFVFSLSATAQEKKAADTTKTTNIQEVVVTSLGIKRQARSLHTPASRLVEMSLQK
jgi:hypothetical protein